MEWTALIVGASGVIWAVYERYYRTKSTDEVKLAKTKTEIINAYETRIRQLEQSHEENTKRITALEGTLDKQKEYITTLVALVQGRDPAIQELLANSKGALTTFTTDTAPKVSELYSHLVPKPAVPGSVTTVTTTIPPVS